MSFDKFLEVLAKGLVQVSSKTPYELYDPDPKDLLKPGRTLQEGIPLLKIRQAMIREDVWQAMLNVKAESDFPFWPDPKSPEWHRKHIEEEWDRLYDQHVWDSRAHTAEEILASFRVGLSDRRKLSDYSQVFKNPGVDFTSTTTLKLLIRKYHAKQITDADKEEILQAASELARVDNIMSIARMKWQPSYPNGPQDGVWPIHRDLHKAFHDIADAKVKKFEEES